jgi:hypothetical protein
MGLGVLEDRVMEHVPGLQASRELSDVILTCLKGQHDTSMIPTDLKLLARKAKASSATEVDQFPSS